MTRALLSLGSNLEPQRHVPAALHALRRHCDIEVVGHSDVFASDPVGGPPGSPRFLNAAIEVVTELEAPALRRELRSIEARLGRVRTDDKDAPRTVDLDIDLYGDEIIRSGEVSVPSNDIVQQPHVAVPAADVAPAWIVPGDGRSLREIADAMSTTGLVRMGKEVWSVTAELAYDTEEAFEGRAGEVYDPEFESLVSQMLKRLGENPDREGLQRTPLRVAKALDFLTSGYSTSVEEVVNDAIFTDDAEEMVILRDIEFYSMCEHHMLPFYGKAHVAYLPNGQIIGLSKMARIVDVFARRLQVQERLTNEVADSLMRVLDPHGVAVVMEGAHLCMLMRGVQKQSSSMITSAMRGTFKSSDRTRAEFLKLVTES